MYRLIAFNRMENLIFKSSGAVANQGEAMEAETILKHGRISKSRMSRNNFWGITCFALLLATVTLMMGCGGGSGGGGSAKIKMTTEKDGYIDFNLAGSGVATVDWGDDSEKVTLTLDENGVTFEHRYPNATIRTITVYGDNIKRFCCWEMGLTSLDVSKNTALTSLECYRRNKLTNLDVSKNTTLTKLSCGNNQLTSLDVSKNTALTYLSCGNNQLTSLDVSKNTALTYLSCGWNQLTNLDVSGAAPLVELDCRGNQLSATALNALFGTLNSNPGGKVIYTGNNPGVRTCDRSIFERKGWREGSH